MGSINERIQFIINEYYNGIVSAFVKDTGVPQSTMNDIVGGKMNEPTNKTSTKILTANTVKINSEWLLTGKGDPLKSENLNYPVKSNLEKTDDPEVKTYNCINCIEKQKLIDQLRKEISGNEYTILVQQKLITEYENKLPKKGQERCG